MLWGRFVSCYSCGVGAVCCEKGSSNDAEEEDVIRVADLVGGFVVEFGVEEERDIVGRSLLNLAVRELVRKRPIVAVLGELNLM